MWDSSLLLLHSKEFVLYQWKLNLLRHFFSSSSSSYRHAGESASHTWEFWNRCHTWESGSRTWGCDRDWRSFHCVSLLPCKNRNMDTVLVSSKIRNKTGRKDKVCVSMKIKTVFVGGVGGGIRTTTETEGV